MFRTDLLSIIRSLDTVFTAIGIWHTQILKMGKITSVYICVCVCLNLRKKPVKCYIWSMALYGAETWALRAADQIYLESFEVWCWRRMEKIS